MRGHRRTRRNFEPVQISVSKNVRLLRRTRTNRRCLNPCWNPDQNWVYNKKFDNSSESIRTEIFDQKLGSKSRTEISDHIGQKSRIQISDRNLGVNFNPCMYGNCGHGNDLGNGFDFNWDLEYMTWTWTWTCHIGPPNSGKMGQLEPELVCQNFRVGLNANYSLNFRTW